MKELFDEIQEIIGKYRIDAVHEINGSYYTQKEAEELQLQKLREYLSEFADWRTVALYGGGRYCESILETVKKAGKNIICIIDNFKSGMADEEIPVVPMCRFRSDYAAETNAVIISSWNYHREFENELVNTGGILNVPAWMIGQFPGFTRPVYEYGRKTYLEINEMELSYKTLENKEKYGMLKKIILALCNIKDFLYAERYVRDMEKDFQEYGESSIYRKAMDEIKERMENCAKQKGKDVLFIHIVDSMSDQAVDGMGWLNEHGKEGIRFRGITVEYPCTYYAVNTMFTGKTPFEIERTTKNAEIGWDDSDLLRFINSGFAINVAVGGDENSQLQWEKTNDNREKMKNYPHFTLPEVLFEGLALWDKRKEKNIILIHSCGEMHASYLRAGGGEKLLVCDDMTEESQFDRQFSKAVEYVDEELQWYDYFYALTGMPMITMGDHGCSLEAVHNHFLGERKDVTRGFNELLLPAFIINRWKNGGSEIKGLIPNTKLPQIIMAVLEDKTLDFEDLAEESVKLEFLPGYGEDYCKNFMKRGIWGQYEGFIGIKTLDEIYLVSASGHEVYSVPEKYGNKNLSDDASYRERIEKCRDMIDKEGFPIDIFKLEKFEKHLKLLEKYDKECYRKIKQRMDKMD